MKAARDAAILLRAASLTATGSPFHATASTAFGVMSNRVARATVMAHSGRRAPVRPGAVRLAADSPPAASRRLPEARSTMGSRPRRGGRCRRIRERRRRAWDHLEGARRTMNRPCGNVEMTVDGVDGAVSSANRDRGTGERVGTGAALPPEPQDGAGPPGVAKDTFSGHRYRSARGPQSRLHRFASMVRRYRRLRSGRNLRQAVHRADRPIAGAPDEAADGPGR